MQGKEIRENIIDGDNLEPYESYCIAMAERSAKEHEQIADYLEELKSIKEMDLSIPQHFTKEQSEWIKSYCIKRNTEFYNKALDDFAKALITMYERYDIDDVFESSDTYSYTSACYIFEHYIDKIAEQLKAGGKK